MRLAIISQAVALADDALGRAMSARLQHGLDLVLAPCARPGCRSSPDTTDATACSSTMGMDQRRLALQRRRACRSSRSSPAASRDQLRLASRPAWRRRRSASPAPRRPASRLGVGAASPRRLRGSRSTSFSRAASALRGLRAARSVAATSASISAMRSPSSTPIAASRSMMPPARVSQRLDAPRGSPRPRPASRAG